MDIYKKQVTELHQTLNEETNKMDKMEFETKKLNENLNTLQKEKDVIIHGLPVFFLELHLNDIIIVLIEIGY